MLLSCSKIPSSVVFAPACAGVNSGEDPRSRTFSGSTDPGWSLSRAATRDRDDNGEPVFKISEQPRVFFVIFVPLFIILNS